MVIGIVTHKGLAYKILDAALQKSQYEANYGHYEQPRLRSFGSRACGGIPEAKGKEDHPALPGCFGSNQIFMDRFLEEISETLLKQ